MQTCSTIGSLHLEKTDPPSKNRVRDFFCVTYSCTGAISPQVPELHQETSTCTTVIVSGVVEWLSKDPIGINGGLNQYVAFGNNPVMFVDPFGEKIYLSGSPADQAELLQVLQQFVRGSLAVNDSYVYREPCAEDEGYEGVFDALIASESIYSIGFGDADIYGGGYFVPGAFNAGGRIVLSRGINREYVGGSIWRPATYRHTTASVLAHEIGHAVTHVNKMKGADKLLPSGDPLKNKLEAAAWRHSRIPYRRMNMGIPFR